MKLTENQKIVIKTLLRVSNVGPVIANWEDKHDRNLVANEILELYSKMKLKVSKEHVRQMREIADRGK